MDPLRESGKGSRNEQKSSPMTELDPTRFVLSVLFGRKVRVTLPDWLRP
ncbi:hypothetical protein C8D95_111123 [Silicimonas algicola]|uniref:Uncharacterized protein n=1 Tax=Silicimonas algicola TaxID=1826607 RepID=A0A316G1K1_9RHOB|nr:hypothetical protein C8D95_111123 [Silicimonas algicola]